MPSSYRSMLLDGAGYCRSGNPTPSWVPSLDRTSQEPDLFFYGAVGDGVTDDTAALQRAVSAVQQAGGGNVFIPPGYNFLITSSILCGGGWPGGVKVHGGGIASQVTLRAGSNCYAFDFGLSGAPQYTPHAVFEDFCLNLNGGSQSAGGGFWARGAVHCKFSRLVIDTPYEAGIRFYQDGTGSYGHHNRITDSVLWNGRSSAGPGYAVLFQSADENVMMGCLIQDNGNPAHGAAAQVYDTGAGLQSFVGNAWVGGGSGSAFFKSDSNPGRCTFTGNQFDTPNGGGQCLELTGSQHTVTGNVFLGMGQGQSSGQCAGVNLDGAQYCTVSGNNFNGSNAYAYAVRESGAADYNCLGLNTFNGTFAGTGPIAVTGSHTTFTHDGLGNARLGGVNSLQVYATSGPSSPPVPGFAQEGSGVAIISSAAAGGTATLLDGKTSDGTVQLRVTNSGALSLGGSASAIRQGSGAPTGQSFASTAGDLYIRTDTPGTASQRLYACTAGGTPGTWTALVV